MRLLRTAPRATRCKSEAPSIWLSTAAPWGRRVPSSCHPQHVLCCSPRGPGGHLVNTETPSSGAPTGEPRYQALLVFFFQFLPSLGGFRSKKGFRGSWGRRSCCPWVPRCTSLVCKFEWAPVAAQGRLRTAQPTLMPERRGPQTAEQHLGASSLLRPTPR